MAVAATLQDLTLSVLLTLGVLSIAVCMRPTALPSRSNCVGCAKLFAPICSVDITVPQYDTDAVVVGVHLEVDATQDTLARCNACEL